MHSITSAFLVILVLQRITTRRNAIKFYLCLDVHFCGLTVCVSLLVPFFILLVPFYFPSLNSLLPSIVCLSVCWLFWFPPWMRRNYLHFFRQYIYLYRIMHLKCIEHTYVRHSVNALSVWLVCSTHLPLNATLHHIYASVPNTEFLLNSFVSNPKKVNK